MFCAAGLYEECLKPEPVDGEPGWYVPCGWLVVDEPEAPQQPTRPEPKEKGLPGRPTLDPDQVKDPLSTGRKRAQQLAPIFSGMVCSWANLRFAGGGVMPIVGCRGNIVASVKSNEEVPEGYDSRGERHHGPDKNVLNNAVGSNLHVVCASCHKHWHSLNDNSYADRPEAGTQFLPDQPYWPHDPFTKATDDELDKSAEWWDIRTEYRDEYPFDTPASEPIEPPKPITADELIENTLDDTFEL